MAESSSSTHKSKGQFISRYEILSQLGEGGMGVVYKAHDPRLNKEVGLKVMKSTIMDDQLQIRFQNEAKSLKDLRHRGIPEIYNFAISRNDEPYIVLEFVEGQTLSHVLEKSGPLDILEALEIFIPACEALAYAHSNGVIHRDIKPENIIITNDADGKRQIKIIDFGLAKLEDELADNQDMTVTGKVIGTPAYMSPEQIRSRKTVAGTDIYALGCTIFEAITGAPPFRGETALETISLHLTKEIEEVFPENLEEEVDLSTIYSIITKSCQKEIEDRYQSASELISDLVQLQEEIAAKALEVDEEPSLEVKIDKGSQSNSKPALYNSAFMLAIVSIIAGFALYLINGDKGNKAGKKLESINKITKERKETQFFYSEDKSWNTFPVKGKGSWSGLEVTTDKNFRELTTKGQLKTIYSQLSNKITGSGLKYLSGTRVSEICLSSTAIDDSALEYAKDLKYLKKFGLSSTDKLSTKGMKALASMNGLQTLSFDAITLPPNSINEIAKVKSLRVLTLGGCSPIHTEDLKKLSHLPNLEVILLDNAKLDDKDISFLNSCKKLRLVSLVELNLNDNDMKKIANLSVEGLVLTNNPITVKTFQLLAKNKYLKMVKAGNCKLIKPFQYQAINNNLGKKVFYPYPRSYSPFDAPWDVLELKY